MRIGKIMSVNIIVFFIWLLAKFLKADSASPADRVFFVINSK